MRKLLIAGLGLALIASMPGAAQVGNDNAALAAQKAALDKFAWMDGTWRGPAVTKFPTGEHRVTQTERIGPMLGGTVRVVEGRGFNPDGSVGFNAFAVISYDAGKAGIRFPVLRARAQRQLHDPADRRRLCLGNPGGADDDPLHRDAEGQGAGPKSASGSRPARPPVPFFEMHLTRVGDTDWPNGGAMTPK